MQPGLVLAVLLILTLAGYRLGRRRAEQTARQADRRLSSRAPYHGLYVALWCGIPALILLLLWAGLQSQIADWLLAAAVDGQAATLTGDRLALLRQELNMALLTGRGPTEVSPEVAAALTSYRSFSSLTDAAIGVVVLCIAIAGLVLARRHINPALRARDLVERFAFWLMLGASVVAILTTIGIVLSLLFESLRFFAKVPFTEFLFGLHWSPQTALRSDQIGASGSFGAIPLFVGTGLITLIAMLTAVPIGLFSAIYLSEYAGPRMRSWVKPALEILAGVPTVVYGFFAALTVAPLLRGWGESVGLDVASESALAAGLVMGLMIIPFVSSLSDDVMTSVPQSLRDGAYALGATKSETICQVVFPAALPGIVGAILLAVSRAIGETMIVVMAAGLAANLTANPLEAVTTVTVQIVTLLVGDQEFDSAKTLSAFALGLTLFVITLSLNFVALRVVHRYREKYD
jgi:phosphate transport system permease protein